MNNSWNYEVPSIADILDRPGLKYLIIEVTHTILRAAGQSPAVAQEVIDFLFDQHSLRSPLELEKVLHRKLFLDSKHKRQLREGMRGRAHVISLQIEKYFRGESLADVGCGHGLVGWSARKHFKETVLFDVSDYLDPDVTLPFVEYSESEDPPFEHPFDCALLITVLHHAYDPVKLLKSVWNHTRKRLIVIESIFGVVASNAKSPLPGLDQATQLCYATYCDWFYNRVLNQDVCVPYNFNTPEGWRSVFSELPAIVSFEENLGVDLDIVPEHHFLFVLDKQH